MSIGTGGANVWRSFVLPGLFGVLALAVAVVGAMFIGDGSGVDEVNAFVEALSGESSTFLGKLGVPLGFSFAAGMVATVNPCGFAMLPAYLSLYLGSNEKAGDHNHPFQHVARALVVGGVVTSGFVLLFGLAGLIIGVGARSVVNIIPWLGLSIGVLVAIAGSWLLAGGKLYTDIPVRASAHIGNPGTVSVRGYFLFGLSYATASFSCALPIFLLVVVSSLEVSGNLVAVGQFFLYALGMGLVITLLTVWMALNKWALVGAIRKTSAFIQPFSGALMILAGAYIVYYWLTIGRSLLA